jgi:hypothetical protein
MTETRQCSPVDGPDEFQCARAEDRRGGFLLLQAPESGICAADYVPRPRSQVLKRLIANSLLLILIASLLVPLALCFQQSSVPACCRRNGKHHCMSGMSSMMASNDKAPAFRTIPSRRPFRSTVATLVPVAQPQVRMTSTSAYVPPSAILAREPESFTFSASAHFPFSQRGPPYALLQSLFPVIKN